ncbi:MAG: hypothetical protein ABL962_12400 [Fimbriimonadaceae bacterium]
MRIDPTALAGCAAKLARTEEQLADLESRLMAFTATCCVIKTKPFIKLRKLEFRVGEVEDPPAILAAIAGEVIHNLRCPLDYLVCTLLQRQGVKATSRHEFPIFTDQSQWEKALEKNVVGLDPEKITLIESLQPFKHEVPHKHPLARLKRLNNDDKHRLMTMGYCVLNRHGFNADPSTFKVTQYADRRPLKVGTKLVTVELPIGMNPAHVELSYLPTFDVVLRHQFPGEDFRTVTSLYRTLQGIRSYTYEEVFANPGLTDGFIWTPSFKTKLKPWQHWIHG